MLRPLRFLLVYFFSWVLLFEAARVLFLVYNRGVAGNSSPATSLQSMWHGLRMDLSMAAYLLMPVCFLALASVAVSVLRKKTVCLVYTAIVLFLFLLITISDLQVFRQWGFRIDATPLKYLSSPKEAWASISHLPLFLYLIIFLLLYGLLFFLFDRMLKKNIELIQPGKRKLLQVVLILVFTGLLFVPMRGGFQLAPINQSSVYFSENNFANQAAINATWNFVHALMNRTDETKNPYADLERKKAELIAQSLLKQSGFSRKVLNNTHPNIILIIWESATSKALTARVDGQEVLPKFRQLIKEGLYFSNVYASGDRTDKGLAAVLSGYPALHSSSIIRTPNKSAKLAVLPQLFKNKGYATPFYYGGEINFANIKSYLYNAGIAPIVEKDAFEEGDLNSKWGAHDGVVARKLSTDLQNLKQPFFATWLTLSSHEPFETPVAPAFSAKNDVQKFLNSLHYSDQVISEFVAHCKQQPWWDSTLLIIVGDHGHVLPPSDKLHNYTIPMLWLGGALSERGVIDKVVSQLDLAATIAAQTNFAATRFPFSKNIFDSSYQPWAYFSFNNGFGFVQPGKAIVFDNIGKTNMVLQGDNNAGDYQKGKALQQFFYQDYLDK